jgi:predicted enzyme related to lactoylglutathione lyase
MPKSTFVPQASGLVIYAKDKEKVANFYRRLLNLETVVDELEFILLQAGNVEITIVRMPKQIAIEIEITSLKPSFLVQSYEQARVEAVAAGGQLMPTDSVWLWRGTKHLDGWDPEGNIFQLRKNDD